MPLQSGYLMVACDTSITDRRSAASSGDKRRRTRRPLICFILFLLALPVHAQVFEEFGDDDPDAPWHIVADEVTYDQANKRFTATGNAEIFKKDRRLSAQRISFDEKHMTAEAEGQVMLIFKDDVLTASKVEIDLRTEVGTLYDGSIFLKENHFIIKGDRISKIGKQEYEIERGSFSTCDGEVPDWRITARKLNVTIEGYGRASHAALWAKKVPVAYIPYIVFPAKRKRQSGLLAPELAFSDRKGTEFIQPFYWAVGDSQDMTFYPQYMSKRGLKLGGEYRYILDDYSKGTLMADYLDDRKTDEGGSSSDDYGYGGDKVLRTNKDRYWLRGKIDQRMPLGFRAAVDIDWVSDQDYLREFKYGPSGYYVAYNTLLDDFGRELDEYDNPVRTNRLNLNRNGDSYSFNGGVLWSENSILQSQGTVDPTVQRLPFAQFDAARQQVFGSPVYFTLGSEYANLYREDGTRGNRAIVAPRLMLPLRAKNYLFIEPSVGASETLYYVTRYGPVDKAASGGDRTLNREAYDLRLDLFSELSRGYATEVFGFDRIRHRLRPQVVYEYVPDIDQEEYPEFDSIDRIPPENRVTYSLVNTFTSRREARRRASVQEDESAAENYDYREFARFKLEQSYNIREARADNPLEFDDGRHRRPFSPIAVELDVFPGKYVSLSYDTEWSTYDSRFLTHNVGTGVEDDRGDRLALNYHYQKGTQKTSADGKLVVDRIEQETISASGLLKLTQQLHLNAGISRDLQNGDTTSTLIGLLYQQQCWSLKAEYEEDDDDRRIGFTILLHGLGGYGTGTSM